jgi:hypothetical protein
MITVHFRLIFDVTTAVTSGVVLRIFQFILVFLQLLATPGPAPLPMRPAGVRRATQPAPTAGPDGHARLGHGLRLQARARSLIVLFVDTSAWSLARFSALPMRVPDRRDHAEAALLHSTCRQAGIQAGTIDVLLAQLCIRHRLVMLTPTKTSCTSPASRRSKSGVGRTGQGSGAGRSS